MYNKSHIAEVLFHKLGTPVFAFSSVTAYRSCIVFPKEWLFDIHDSSSDFSFLFSG